MHNVWLQPELNTTTDPDPQSPVSTERSQQATNTKEANPATTTPPRSFFVERPTDPVALEKFWAQRSIVKDYSELVPEKYYPAYEEQPEYGEKVDPSRIKQFVGDDPYKLPPLKLICPTHAPLALTDSPIPFDLIVKTTPNKWTTFYAPEEGTFEENGKFSITVKADKNGYARVRFRTGPGEGTYTVLVGCPYNFAPPDELFRIEATTDKNKYERWLNQWKPIVESYFAELRHDAPSP